MLLAIISAISAVTPAVGRGVSPYLPLNLLPDIERQIERVLALAGKPVMRRPIAAAVVLDALPTACAVDAALCARVKEYLQTYQRNAGVNLFQGRLSASSGNESRVLPNAHGQDAGSSWQVAGNAYYQPSDYLLLNAGGVAYEGRVTPTGSVLSMGFDFAQLDVGFRDHWLSPLTDSSWLVSTEAPTMPSVTLSNYTPIGFIGLNYEVFLAEMSPQNGITYFNETTSGKPLLSGVQIGIEPVTGYSLAINRVMQSGGGARGGVGLRALTEAFLNNGNLPDVAGQSQEFGNQVASITSSIVFPGRVPFVARVEYAGEDGAYKDSRRLGDTALSLGIDFPKLGERYDLSYELSEWQNQWYVHHLYPRGLTNNSRVIGHWSGDQRAFADQKRGSSHSLQFGLQADSGDYWRATYRTLQFQQSLGYDITPPISYQRLHELGLQYTTSWRSHIIGAELVGGQDVFGDSFARLSATFDLAQTSGSRAGALESGSLDDQHADIDVFVDIGAHSSSVLEILTQLYPAKWTEVRTGYHFGVGARHPVSKRGDLGVRLELDEIDGQSLISVRALDYRYRITGNLAASTFFGVGRYQYGGAPALGYYWGAGLQWMDVFPKWDIVVDLRHYDKLSRNRVLPDDFYYADDRPRLHFDVKGQSLYLSRRF